MAGYYDPKKDYSKAISEAKAAGKDTSQLEAERQNKIDDKYGGKEPNMWGSDKTYSQASRDDDRDTISNAVSISNSKGYDSSGNYYGGSTTSNKTGTVNVKYDNGVNYAQEAINAAARGDWGAVATALAQRNAKIAASGGNDRGLSNSQLLAQLQQQYSGSYGDLSSRDQNLLTLYSGGSLQYPAAGGGTGDLMLGTGWQEGVDYYAEALKMAQNGDLDGAYDALMRRGFKMQDTGSTGNGISQAQAYSAIHQAYINSTGAANIWNSERDTNAQWIAKSGATVNPNNAYKTLKKGDYYITYDGNGVPVYSGTKYQHYTPDQIDALAAYYDQNASTDNYMNLYVNKHNAQVDATGVGRKYNTDGSLNITDADVPTYDREIDLEKIYSSVGGTGIRGGVTVPTTRPTLPSGNIGGWATGNTGGGIGGGIGGTGTGETGNTGNTGNTGYEYTGTDLTDYLKELYAKNLEAELANLKSTYDTNVADLEAQQKDIKQQFEAARNQTAAQYDLGRMRFNEYALANGLNTGTAGQGVLAQSAAYQGNLADIGSQEASAMSDNSLQLTNLEAQYNAAINEAKATGDFQLAQALYDELVRQENVAIQQQLAAQEQANWEKQFEYQQQLAAQSQSNWERQFAYQQQLDSQDYAMSQQQLAAQSQQRDYEYAMTLLSSGVMPDLATLQSAGISQGEAAFMQQMVLGSMNTTTTNKAASKAGGTHISGAKPVTTNTSGYNNGSLTTAQVKQLQKKLGVTADGKWGRKSSTAAKGLTADEAWAKYGGYDMSFEELKRTLTRYLSLGGAQRAQNILDAHWDSLTPAQQLELNNLFG